MMVLVQIFFAVCVFITALILFVAPPRFLLDAVHKTHTRVLRRFVVRENKSAILVTGMPHASWKDTVGIMVAYNKGCAQKERVHVTFAVDTAAITTKEDEAMLVGAVRMGHELAYYTGTSPTTNNTVKWAERMQTMFGKNHLPTPAMRWCVPTNAMFPPTFGPISGVRMVHGNIPAPSWSWGVRAISNRTSGWFLGLVCGIVGAYRLKRGDIYVMHAGKHLPHAISYLLMGRVPLNEARRSKALELCGERLRFVTLSEMNAVARTTLGAF